MLGRKIIEPKEEMTVSEWAEKYRFVTREESVNPGKWDNSFMPFAIEPMDSFNVIEVQEIVFMGSAQVCKTEIIKNAIGYTISRNPKKILLVYPIEDDARDFSLQKLQPMLERNECIYINLENPNNRKENKTLYKKFVGGNLWLTGSHSPNSLARRSTQWIIVDDGDRMIGAVGQEGDPWYLAKQRTESYRKFEFKHALFSTPTEKGNSRSEKLYEQSDQRKYYVPCPFCGESQTLEWEQLKWEKEKDLFGQKTLKHLPETAVYECIKCKEWIDESYKKEIVAKGKWVAKFQERKKQRGYSINRLYSPLSTWADMASEFLNVKDDEETLKTFWNTSLGRTWESEDIETIEDKSLLKRVEHYLTHEFPHTPNGVLLTTAAIDVQGDRLEVMVAGFGIGKESWILSREIFNDNPQQDDVWKDAFDYVFDTVFIREDGIELKVKRLFVDNGAYTNRVNEVLYNLRKEMRAGKRTPLDPNDRKNFGVWGIKGKAGMDRPLIPRAFTKSYKNRLFTMVVGVDNAKTTIFKRLGIKTPGPKYIHFTKAFCDITFFEQFLSERRIPKYNMRGTTYYWELIKKGMRNEPFDLFVYNIAAEEHLNPNYEAIKAQQIKMIEYEKEEKFETETPVQPIIKKKTVSSNRKSYRSSSNWN